MSCLLPLIAGLCLMDPTELTFTADVTRQMAGEFRYWNENVGDVGGATIGETGVKMYVPLNSDRTWRLNYHIVHSSIIHTDADRGQERYGIGIEWRPFARKAAW